MRTDGEGQRKILIVGESPGCVSGDTLIETAFRDKSKYPKGIPIRDLVGMRDFYVYSYDIENQKMVIDKAKKVWKTGRKKVYRVMYQWWWSDGYEHKYVTDSIVVTGNHKFLLKRGKKKDPFRGINKGESEYLSIDDGLSVGHSIQPFHRNVQDGYGYVGPSHDQMDREPRFLLSFKVGRELKKREQCHHKNENKANDSWDNLEMQSIEDHARLHTESRNPMDNPKHREAHTKAMNNPEYKENHSKRMKKFLSDPEQRKRRIEQIHKQREQTSETVKKLHKNPEYRYRFLKGRQKITGCSDRDVIRKFMEEFPGADVPEDNHKVISIEPMGVMDVFDIEVENYHNFAANGIFIHNSEEDRRGIPFCGPAGSKLQSVLSKLGIDLRRDCWILNSVACHPEKDATPLKAVDFCRPNVFNEIRRLNPEVIILLGAAAVKSVIGWLWKEDAGGISRWAGFKIPCQRPNVWIIPTWHPAAILHAEKEGKRDPVLELQFEEHLRMAVETQGRPWKAVPDWKREVELVYSPDVAASILRKMIAKGGTVAFDFETDRLKPDHPDARIVCCSVCWEGKKTIAFPWHGEVITAMRELVRSDLGKVGFNCKFESRWCMAKMGTRVRNWISDGMLDAHILDNRPAVTSLKFQVFVRLGQESYDDNIKPFLKSDNGGNGVNQIHKVPIAEILRYCGTDSLAEYRLWEVQQRDLNNEQR